MKKRVNLIGRKFGRLTVTASAEPDSYGHHYWTCLCECGNSKRIPGSGMLKGASQSCGCLHNELLGAQKTIHGDSKTRFYSIWKGMIKRCYNKASKNYKDYGAAGITVTEEWLEYDGFKKDMLVSYEGHQEIYGTPDTTIDRIDNDLGYAKDNCRWATRKTQSINRRIVSQPK